MHNLAIDCDSLADGGPPVTCTGEWAPYLREPSTFRRLYCYRRVLGAHFWLSTLSITYLSYMASTFSSSGELPAQFSQPGFKRGLQRRAPCSEDAVNDKQTQRVAGLASIP